MAGPTTQPNTTATTLSGSRFKLDIIVLPNLAPTNNLLKQLNLPYVYVERNGVWVDMTSRDTEDMAAYRRASTEQLDKLMASLDSLQAAGQSADISFSLKALCRKMYNRLVPKGVQDLISELATQAAAANQQPVLRFHTPIDWIPWELLVDQTNQHLGTRFAIARLPLTQSAPQIIPGQTLKISRVFSMLGEHVLDTTELAVWQATFPSLGTGVTNVMFPNTSNGSPFPSLSQLEQSVEPSILHITCHGGIEDTSGQVFWTLNDKAIIPEQFRITREVVELLGEQLLFNRALPLVFGNACASNRAAAASTNGSGSLAADAGLTPGFGPTFFAQGAAAFVGTFAPVSKRIAVLFAKRFYQHLLVDKQPIAQAILTTKSEFRAENELDPSYLFYCLYGLPDTLFEL